jgi:hypothetical protein
MLIVSSIALSLLAPAIANADEPDVVQAPPPRQNPKNAVSVPLVGILNGAWAIQYERFFAPPRISFATSIGFRTSGGHDFDTFEGTFGAEGRFWLIGKEVFSKFDGPAMVGPYIGIRTDVGMTKVSQNGHVLGTSMAISEALLIGVRLAFLRTIEITPNVGFGLRHEFDPSGRLAPWTRPELVRLGLNAGVLF